MFEASIPSATTAPWSACAIQQSPTRNPAPACITASEAIHVDLTKLRDFARTRPRLAPREIEVAAWSTTGKSDWQIAQILMVSPKTVNYHIEKAKRKFDVATRMQVVVIALRLGLLDERLALIEQYQQDMLPVTLAPEKEKSIQSAN